ncbi:MAG: ribosomal L7Ae/L30e/S12e/Gadd45 family protein [Ruminococcus sp.]|nr:ribosomal L7Ae/L30e/S12e/Gadd45 family protein [Ruminococcus sp.]
MNDKILGLLGLCRRAGKLTPGNDAVIDDIQNHRASLVIVTADISKNTEKKLTTACRRFDTEIVTLDRSKDELSFAIGKFSTVVAVCDEGFAKKLYELITNENKEENVYD